MHFDFWYRDYIYVPHQNLNNLKNFKTAKESEFHLSAKTGIQFRKSKI